MTELTISNDKVIEATARVVSAFSGNNAVDPNTLHVLVRQVYDAFVGIGKGESDKAEPVRPQPAVPISRSVKDDHIVCLEDGLKFRTLKRHLRQKYDLTPEQYRARWNLPADYPMVAPAYARMRSDMAREIGLGRKPSAAASKGRKPGKKPKDA